MSSFEDLHLSPTTLQAVSALGFEEPTPIQEKAIPHALAGRDIIGQAQTGTGKTAAFAIPIVERLVDVKIQPAALIVTPTRELCLQVTGDVAKIGQSRNITTLPVYGGQSLDRQVRALRRGVDVVIGTPGRLLDHLRRGTLKLTGIQVVVLDEADEMLDMGFAEDIDAILAKCPANRQTMLFSATMPEAIIRLARRHLTDPEQITVAPEQVTVPLITQVYYEIKMRDRVEALARILDVQDVDKAIIFCRTKRTVDEVAESLKVRGYLAEPIHGDLSQRERERVMGQFRRGDTELLVATDVAARGLDISDISHVINYEIPQDAESYVHRIGRTGRAGKAGEAITLIVPREFRQLREIERAVKTRIQRRDVPSVHEMVEKKRDILKERLVQAIERGRLQDYRTIVEEVLEEGDWDSVDVAAAALQMWAGDDVREEKPDAGPRLVIDAARPADSGAEPGMTRLFINVGREQGVSPADIVRTVASLGGTPGNLIGLIKIFDRFTFVEVPEENAKAVIEGVSQATIRGRTVNVEPARAKI